MIAACVVVAGIAGVRLVRRTRLCTFGFMFPFDLVTQVLLVVARFVLLFSPGALTRGLSLRTHPTWHDIAFAVARRARVHPASQTTPRRRRPGRNLPRSVFSAITLVVIIYVSSRASALGLHFAGALTALRRLAPSSAHGIVAALQAHLPNSSARR